MNKRQRLEAKMVEALREVMTSMNEDASSVFEIDSMAEQGEPSIVWFFNGSNWGLDIPLQKGQAPVYSYLITIENGDVDACRLMADNISARLAVLGRTLLSATTKLDEGGYVSSVTFEAQI